MLEDEMSPEEFEQADLFYLDFYLDFYLYFYLDFYLDFFIIIRKNVG